MNSWFILGINSVLSIISQTGYVMFLLYVKETPDLTQRALNVLMCILALTYIIFSSALIIVDLMFVWVWSSSWPLVQGNTALQIFIFLVNLRSSVFLMITLTSILQRFKPKVYLFLSLNVKWIFVVIIQFSLLIIYQAIINLFCQDTESFVICVPEKMKVVAIPCEIFNLLAQLVILGDVGFKQRTKLKKWILSRWHHFMNHVVQIGDETAGLDERRVVVAVINLHDWNQIKVETRDIIGPITMSITCLLTMTNFILNIVVGIEDSELVRSLINHLVMASTIIIWNCNKEELKQFSKNKLKNLFKGPQTISE